MVAGNADLSCGPAEEGAGITADTKLNGSQPCVLVVNKVNHVVVYVRRVASRLREVSVCGYLGLVKLHLQVCM